MKEKEPRVRGWAKPWEKQRKEETQHMQNDRKESWLGCFEKSQVSEEREGRGEDRAENNMIRIR
eukprot:9332029-Prorocentrum_lima.AAC.1